VNFEQAGRHNYGCQEQIFQPSSSALAPALLLPVPVMHSAEMLCVSAPVFDRQKQLTIRSIPEINESARAQMERTSLDRQLSDAQELTRLQRVPRTRWISPDFEM